MWDRSEIKANAKAAFKANYWKTVLVCAVFVLLTTGGGAGSGRSVADSASAGTSGSFDVTEMINRIASGYGMEMLAFIVAAALGLILIMVAIGICIDIFVVNPLEVGISSFCVKNMHEKAHLGEIGHGFDKHFGTNVKTMFVKDWCLFWWFCLLIIPGIVKSYEYRMIPYILADNDEITKSDAFRLSKEMMTGHKWDMFVLDLSFIGWKILGLLTCGILSVLYVNPYYQMSVASAYETLK